MGSEALAVETTSGKLVGCPGARTRGLEGLDRQSRFLRAINPWLSERGPRCARGSFWAPMGRREPLRTHSFLDRARSVPRPRTQSSRYHPSLPAPSGGAFGR